MSTEKRLFLFLVLTFLVLAGYSVLMEVYGPKKAPPVVKGKDGAAKAEDPAKSGAAVPPVPGAASPENAQANGSEKAAAKSDPQAPPQQPAAGAPALENAPAAPATAPHQVVSLGNYKPAEKQSPLLVTLNSRGGAVERLELVGRHANEQLRYRDLDNTSGYLGHLSLTLATDRGCTVNVVPAGTPAALATAPGFPPGLRPGDRLLSINDKRINLPADADAALAGTRPGHSAKLVVEREKEPGAPATLEFTAKLDVRPFEIIKPEPLEKSERKVHPASLLVSVRSAKKERDAFLDRFNELDWETKVAGDVVEFRLAIPATAAPEFGLDGPLEVIKRYRLGSPLADATGEVNSKLPYHLELELELRNIDTQPRSVTYRLDGPNGLPTEGWWYLTKLHPRWFSSAGARDVVLNTIRESHTLIGCSTLLKQMKSDEKSPKTPLFSENEPPEARGVRYVGVDTQYFGSVLLPQPDKPQPMQFARAEALVWGDPQAKPKGWERTANTTFQLTSEPIEIGASESTVRRFRLFAGPKAPELLDNYGLHELIYHGWPIFGLIARMLGGILHIFYGVIGNYGIAIILLTVLVRSCMFPISRTAARNAAMMQELSPEMRKIAEKYKNNLEARGKAQQELFRKHNYNPLSGCWLMFLQLPVFIGLYRCLAIDIELRQAPLIPGWEWCSNLAGPDKAFFWKSDFFSYFTDESGWLGPFFNILPIFTIGLFLLHQKLFTPPATDEQTEMQMKMMKFMTVIMGVLFYKVPAGLCLYFITSSLWGIAERKLLPKPKPKLNDGESGGDQNGGGGGGNGGKGGFSLAALLQPKAPEPDDNGASRKKELERKLKKRNS